MPSGDAVVPVTSSNVSAPSRPVTRLPHNIRKPKQYSDGTVCYGLSISIREPSTFHEAFVSNHWKAAIDEEVSALIKNKTWHLVSPSQGRWRIQTLSD